MLRKIYSEIDAYICSDAQFCPRFKTASVVVLLGHFDISEGGKAFKGVKHGKNSLLPLWVTSCNGDRRTDGRKCLSL